MAESQFTQGGDAKAISEVARKHFGGDYAAMFKHHGWPERGRDMMLRVQTRVASTYGSVKAFQEYFKARNVQKKPPPPATDFNDKPIETPDKDIFGFDNFAIAIADSIAKINKPVGSVIAIYGRWGSGKSSTINLIRHHLQPSKPRISVISFQCWHYSSEDAMVAGFFREMYAGLNPALSDETMRDFIELGTRVAGATGNLIGSLVGTVTGTGQLGGDAAKLGIDAIKDYIKAETGSEKLQSKVAKKLDSYKGRFLVVIDDLDRMSTDEALLVFKLIKSVGRLPNIIYLLSYDQEIIEDAVAEKYPSEGKRYLEKIIQAGFNLPKPGQRELHNFLIDKIDKVIGYPQNPEQPYFGNIFYDIVAPEIQTPRDVLRLTNALSVTWPAVRGEVNVADFVALETIRLFRPGLYDMIRSNKSRLTGLGYKVDKNNQFGKNILASIEQADQDRMGNYLTGKNLKDTLKRLFPRLDAQLTNSLDLEEYAREKRVCSRTNFDTYFRFSVSGETIPSDEVHEFISQAGNEKYVREILLNSLEHKKDSDRAKSLYLLNELINTADVMPLNRVKDFLITLLSIADRLEKGLEGNMERILRLTEKLILNYPDLNKRSAILKQALKTASLECLINISNDAYKACYPGNGNIPKPQHKCLLTESDVLDVRKQALKEIRKAAKDGRLINFKNLPFLLFRWRDMVAPDFTEVEDWCSRMISDNETLPNIAEVFLRETSHRDVEDIVAEYHDSASSHIEELLDADQFRIRLNEAVNDESIPSVKRDIIQRLHRVWIPKKND